MQSKFNHSVLQGLLKYFPLNLFNNTEIDCVRESRLHSFTGCSPPHLWPLWPPPRLYPTTTTTFNVTFSGKILKLTWQYTRCFPHLCRKTVIFPMFCFKLTESPNCTVLHDVICSVRRRCLKKNNKGGLSSSFSSLNRKVETRLQLVPLMLLAKHTQTHAHNRCVRVCVCIKCAETQRWTLKGAVLYFHHCQIEGHTKIYLMRWVGS